jgi:hypothetical protein
MDFRGENLFPALSAQSVSELGSAESHAGFWRAAFFTPLEKASEPLVIGNNVLVLYPREESNDEESTEGDGFDTFYPTWISSNAERSLRSHFTGSKKLEDRFFATYLKYFYQPH